MDKRKRSDEDGDTPAKRQKKTITTTNTTVKTITTINTTTNTTVETTTTTTTTTNTNVETTTTTTTTITTEEHTEPNTPAVPSVGINAETALEFVGVEDRLDNRTLTREQEHDFLTTDTSSSYPNSKSDSKSGSFTPSMSSESDGCFNMLTAIRRKNAEDRYTWAAERNNDVLTSDSSDLGTRSNTSNDSSESVYERSRKNVWLTGGNNATELILTEEERNLFKVIDWLRSIED